MIVSPRPINDGEPQDANEIFVAEVVRAVGTVISGPAALHTPEFRGNEWKYVKECLDTEWVSTAGQYVTRFEQQLVEITGARHAIAMINGTAALHACLLAVGIQRDDEVIVPAITFAGTANSVAHAGAHPHFVDIEEQTLGLDPAKLQARLVACAELRGERCVNKLTGRPIRGVVAVHTFGHACDLDGIATVARTWRLPLIEDAAESLGSYYRGRHTGTFGACGMLSFNGNKIVTTGGGGAVVTDDDALATKLRHLTTTAKQPHRWEFIHDAVGYNYRLPNLNAALGCAQLERLDDFLERKRRLAAAYRNSFAHLEGVRFFDPPIEDKSNFWLNVILIDAARAAMRDSILSSLHARGFEARPAWRPLHLLAPYELEPRGDLPCAEDIYRRLINLPSSPRLASNM